MFDSAVYYVQPNEDRGYAIVSQNGSQIGAFSSHDDALSLAKHLGNSAAELGMAARVFERFSDETEKLVFERWPIRLSDLPWDAVTD
ncbi:hypothetical protein [Kaistia granuli]|uniref:hypothetical protein n=1 Tax=Kaistia granuli TaxID=363259 RepID=UPI000378F2C2|nr:hypothetical protein [Kaistia granuli]